MVLNVIESVENWICKSEQVLPGPTVQSICAELSTCVTEKASITVCAGTLQRRNVSKKEKRTFIASTEIDLNEDSKKYATSSSH
jgi:hypothetical protein